MPRQYAHLTPDERFHFVEHGWLKVPCAIAPEYLHGWMENLWTRLGYDPHDKSTWKETYLKLPRHREVPIEAFCPEAWRKMVELVGGESVIDPVRERHYGDQFIINFGNEELAKKLELKGQVRPAKEAHGWHTDNDWYRQFLDSSGNALTVICCFTDIPARGGGTVLAEDGLEGVCQYLYDHPEGLDPPFEQTLYTHIPQCERFTTIEAKAGDVFLTHGLLPHTFTDNYLHYARVISNPHLNMVEPFNLDREDGDYTLCEQVILRALHRSSVPEYRPTRPRTVHYPRTAYFKRARITDELSRMLQAAADQGKGPESVDSIYLRDEEAVREHERRNGYDKAFGENGVLALDEAGRHVTVWPEGKQVFGL